jgi:putative endonuclease
MQSKTALQNAEAAACRDRDDGLAHHEPQRSLELGRTKPTTLETGAHAEDRAVALLEAHGYAIVERNYTCKIGELDIVAVDGSVMAFVEVRSRADDEHGDAVESITRRKQAHVRRTAEVYLRHRRPPYEEFRFDVVAINADEIALYQDAWRGGLL